MRPEDDWDLIRAARPPLFGIGASGVLRLVLLFGSAAVALALILTPIADSFTRSSVAGAPGVDFMSTGSIAKGSSYTIRRSVMQAPGAVCIIRSNGSRSGDC